MTDRSQESIHEAYDRPGARRFSAREALVCVFLAALLLVLFEGPSIRRAGEQMNREGLPPSAFSFRYSCEMATAAPRPQRDELVIEAPGTAARRISLDQEHYRLGRSSTNELAFPSDPKLSREHLVFGRNEPGLQHRHQTWASAISANSQSRYNASDRS